MARWRRRRGTPSLAAEESSWTRSPHGIEPRPQAKHRTWRLRSRWHRPDSDSPHWRSAAFETTLPIVIVNCSNRREPKKIALSGRSRRAVRSSARTSRRAAFFFPTLQMPCLLAARSWASSGMTSESKTADAERPISPSSFALVADAGRAFRSAAQQESMRSSSMAAANPPGGDGCGKRSPERGEAAYRRVADELRQVIWDPLLTHVSNATRVFVVPDGALHLVSFAALPTGTTQYLVETGPSIHYLSAERDLVSAATSPTAGNGLVALGAPAFDEFGSTSVASAASFRGTRSGCGDFQSMRFDPLPASLKEVDEVVSLWNKAQDRSARSMRRSLVRLIGTAASESAFKSAAAGRRILHLATHGFFLGSRCGSALGSVDIVFRDGSARSHAKTHCSCRA